MCTGSDPFEFENKWNSFSKKKRVIALVIAPSITARVMWQDRAARETFIWLAATGKLRPDTNILFIVPSRYAVLDKAGGDAIDIATEITTRNERSYILYDETGELPSDIPAGSFTLDEDDRIVYTGAPEELDKDVMRKIANAVEVDFADVVLSNMGFDAADVRKFVRAHGSTITCDRLKRIFGAYTQDRMTFPLSAEDIDNTIAFQERSAESDPQLDNYIRKFLFWATRPESFGDEELDKRMEEFDQAIKILAAHKEILDHLIKRNHLPVTFSFDSRKGGDYIPDVNKATFSALLEALGTYDVLSAHLDRKVPLDDLLLA